YLLEAAVLVGDRTAAATLRNQLAPAASQATANYAVTCVARHLGAAAVLLGEREQAQIDYQQALAVGGRIRFRPELALTHLQYAELLADDVSQQAEARAHLAAALPELEQMAMPPALARAQALAERLGLVPHRVDAPRHPAGLSAREVEVLRLIAA